MDMSFAMGLEQGERPPGPESLQMEILRADLAAALAENKKLEKLVADLQKENELLSEENDNMRKQLDKAMMDFDEAATQFDHLMIDSAVKNSELQKDALALKVETMMLKSKINELTKNEFEEQVGQEQDSIPESAEIKETPDLDLKQLLFKYSTMVGFSALFLLGCKYGFPGSSSLAGAIQELLQEVWTNVVLGLEVDLQWDHPPRI